MVGKEFSDGKAIIIVRPEMLQDAVRLVQPGLPPPGVVAPAEAPAAAIEAQAITALKLSARVLVVLDRAEVRTIGALTAWAAEDLLALDGFGDKSLAVVRRSLASVGLTLRGE